jgi:hypothetical protein
MRNTNAQSKQYFRIFGNQSITNKLDSTYSCILHRTIKDAIVHFFGVHSNVVVVEHYLLNLYADFWVWNLVLMVAVDVERLE